jgi:hypothetical protein
VNSSPPSKPEKRRDFTPARMGAAVGVLLLGALGVWLLSRSAPTGQPQQQATTTTTPGGDQQPTSPVAAVKQSEPQETVPPAQEIAPDRSTATQPQQNPDTAQCPAASHGSYFPLTLNVGFEPDPYVRRVEPGGILSLARCSANMRGWVSARSDMLLTYQTDQSYPLTFNVRSGIATILLINAPNGGWHYEDGGGRSNPTLRFARPQSGPYHLWVGTLGESRSGQTATIEITERQR